MTDPRQWDAVRTVLYMRNGFWISDLTWNCAPDGFRAGERAQSCAHRYGTACGCRKWAEHHSAHWRWIGGHGWWGDDRGGYTEALHEWLFERDDRASYRHENAWASVEYPLDWADLDARAAAIVERRSARMREEAERFERLMAEAAERRAAQLAEFERHMSAQEAQAATPSKRRRA